MADARAEQIDASDQDSSGREPFIALVRQRARSQPGAPLLCDLSAGMSFTYAEFYQESLRWAVALQRRSVEPGHRVAAMLPTSADAFLAQAALSWIGAVCVPVDPGLRGRPLAHVLAAARVRHVLTTRASLEANTEIFAAADTAGRVVVLDCEDAGTDQMRAVARAEFLAGGERLPGLGRSGSTGASGPIDPVATQAIIFTSGTSGPAKPVALSFDAMDNYARHMFPDDDRQWSPDGAYYSPWTTAHALGSIALAVAVTRGLRLVVRDGFDAGHFWGDVNEHNCQLALTINVTPMLWRQSRQSADQLNPLQMLGVTPLFREFRQFEQRFGVQVTTIYGMTEIGPALTSRAPIGQRSVGIPSSGYECRLADASGADVAPGEVGELLVRHRRRSSVMTGYDGLDEATKTAWRGGWFHTGDRFVEELGQLSFVDRMTDSIRHHGHNVSSFEIEEEVGTLADVAICACVAYQSELDGAPDEDVRLFVVPLPGRKISPGAVHRHLAGRLPRFMLPRYIDVVDELPVNATGKVLKARLRLAPLTQGTWDRHADPSVLSLDPSAS